MSIPHVGARRAAASSGLMSSAVATRALTREERRLAAWMLEHGLPEARDYLPQLESAAATLWRCPCGCASLNLKVADQPEAPPGVHVLGDFIFGTPDQLSGAFIYASAGILSGLEICSLPSPGVTSRVCCSSVRGRRAPVPHSSPGTLGPRAMAGCWSRRNCAS